MAKNMDEKNKQKIERDIYIYTSYKNSELVKRIT